MLPALCHLSRVLEVTEDDPAYMVKYKQSFAADMDTRKEKTNITWLRVATALDPRLDCHVSFFHLTSAFSLSLILSLFLILSCLSPSLSLATCLLLFSCKFKIKRHCRDRGIVTILLFIKLSIKVAFHFISGFKDLKCLALPRSMPCSRKWKGRGLHQRASHT